MTSIFYEPLTFTACSSRSIKGKIGSYTLPIIGIEDLIIIKSNVKRYDGNMKDLVDAQQLKNILARRKTMDINSTLRS